MEYLPQSFVRKKFGQTLEYIVTNTQKWKMDALWTTTNNNWLHTSCIYQKTKENLTIHYVAYHTVSYVTVH